MAKINLNTVVLLAVTLMVIAIVLPIGLAYIGSLDQYTHTYINATSGNETTVHLNQIIDPAVITLLTILLPILVVIGIIMYYIPRNR